MGGDCSYCKPIDVDVTSKGKCYRITLIVLAIINIGLIICQIVFGAYMNIFSLVMVLILLTLLCILHHYFFAMFLAFFSFFNLMFNLVFLGQRLQNYLLHIEDDEFLNEKIALTWVELANLIYNIVLIIVTFLAYREFKAITYGSFGAPNYGNSEERRPLNSNNNDSQRFPGHGTMVGGS